MTGKAKSLQLAACRIERAISGCSDVQEHFKQALKETKKRAEQVAGIKFWIDGLWEMLQDFLNQTEESDKIDQDLLIWGVAELERVQ